MINHVTLSLRNTLARPAPVHLTSTSAASVNPTNRITEDQIKMSSITTTLSATTTTVLSPSMSFLLRHHRTLTSLRLRPRCRSHSSLAAVASVRPSTSTWTRAPLRLIHPATSDGTLFHISIDVSDYPDLVTAHTVPGQYLQVRIPEVEDAKPAFLAIASPPVVAEERGEFEFLVKVVSGSTAEVLCGMAKGEVVELSAVMGKGFPVERIDGAQSVFMFATGSGISAIRSLIESDVDADKRSKVKLYYGARNVEKMAYQDRFKEWESSGVTIIPVLSQPDDKWDGEIGYVQAAFARTKQILIPSSTGAVLCGHKQMAEDVTSTLVADGVSSERILMNF